MTAVRLGILRPSADGLVRVDGRVALRPHARHTTAPDEPTDVVLPSAFTVQLTASEPAPVVELEAGWVWVGRESIAQSGIIRHVLVPASAEVIDWADLADVDPSTLEPSPEALAGWTAAVQTVEASIVSAEAQARAAAQSATQAAGAATTATLAAEESQRLAASAAAEAQLAAESRTAAASSASSAATSATDAQTALTEAQAIAKTPGPSAYAVAVANGFVGTETEWLESLHGSDSASLSYVGDGIYELTTNYPVTYEGDGIYAIGA